MTQRNLNKEITLETIKMNGFSIGKTVRGKGVEILLPNNMYASKWSDTSNNVFLKQTKDKMAKEGIRLEQLIVDTFYDKVQCRYLNDSEKPSIDDILNGNALSTCSEIYLYKKGKAIGYIPISRYDSSRESQMQLVENLIKLEGKELIGEFDDFDGLTFSRGYHDDSLYCGDYSQIHGESWNTLDTGDCEYFDGRLNSSNGFRLNDFWQFDELTEDGWFDEIDPNNEYTIFHRKGKDFYISPSLEEENVEISFWDGTLKEYNEEREYQERENCWDTEVFTAMTCTENNKIEAKLLDALESKKEGLEAECYIYNELELGNSAEECFDYNDKVFDLWLFDHIFEDKWEARSYVLENLNWEKDVKEACKDLSEKILNKYVTFLIDGTIFVKSDYSDKTTKLTKLRNLKRLQSRFGYQLVWSAVNPDASESYRTYGLAIKVGQEEYHFEVKELFDEDVRVVDFISSILSSIQRRVVMQKAKEKFKTSANKVFVGFDDSLQSGNCYFGTEDFCQKHQIDRSKIGAIRGDVLLSMEKSVFTERAVIQAIIAHGQIA